MKLCGKDCIPCCDFCIHMIEEQMEIKGKIVNMGPIGCKYHPDEEHQNIARGCWYCDDFCCFTIKDVDKEGE